MEGGVDSEPNSVSHVVAMPYPGRGHINPMMNLCKLLASTDPNNFLITFIVTEEWLGLIGSDPKPDSIRFATIPNVIPSDSVKSLDFPSFYESVMTKLEASVDRVLQRLQPPPTAIISDVELLWATELGNRRNIPVATLFTMPAAFFSALYHLHLFALDNRNSPVQLLLESAETIPGISASNLADLRAIFLGDDSRVAQLLMDCISKVRKAQFLLFTTVYELEEEEIETLKANLPCPVYSVGPSIPYLDLHPDSRGPEYLKWLDSQPESSVLYISMGSFLSVSGTQMDEILAGIHDSGVRYLWIARGETSRLKDTSNGGKGLVLPWCDQLRVLSHSSVGGFWTHCGWNSTLEAIFAGVPMLTFPLFLDQFSNSKQILEKWRIGRTVERRGKMEGENFITREEIADLVRKFMDLECNEMKEIRQRARQAKDICQRAIAQGGSSVKNLDQFIRNILQSYSP